MRAKLALGGIGRPLEALNSMHAVLDVVEQMAVDAKISEGGDALQQFYFALYKPDPLEVKKLIQEEDMDDGFDAFASLGFS